MRRRSPRTEVPGTSAPIIIPSRVVGSTGPTLLEEELEHHAAEEAEPEPSVDPDLVHEWEARLACASRLGAELSAATDELNASLRSAEQALTNLKLGVSASVPLYPGHRATELDDEVESLRFGKDGGAWRLLYVTEPAWANDPEDIHESALLNASKEIRLQAAARLPALFDELIKTAEAQVAQVRARAAEVAAFAATLARKK